MSPNSPPHEKPAARWRPYAFLALGVACVAAAAVLAQRTDFADKLRLDFQGERARGTAQALEGGGYRLTYRHPAGTIYSQTRRDARLGLDIAPGKAAPVTVSYLPDRPDRFQPAGQAYRPGVAVGILMFVGLTLVLLANRRIRHRRRPQGERPGPVD